MARVRCPKCGRFARTLTEREKGPHYTGTYSLYYFNDCCLKCSYCGIVDPRVKGVKDAKTYYN